MPIKQQRLEPLDLGWCDSAMGAAVNFVPAGVVPPACAAGLYWGSCAKDCNVGKLAA